MSKQEYVDKLMELGFSISYEPRVLFPEFRGGVILLYSS